ncbi:MAG: GAF domain-containing sensor histidine kinase [Chloroflexi bacterium]|nr:GAF domain-containing sensor histidine kinase [Chloroflexota bacterium]
MNLEEIRSETLQANVLIPSAQDSAHVPQAQMSDQVQRLDRALASLERISHALTTTTQGVEVLLQTIVKTVAEVFGSQFVCLTIKTGYKELSAIYPPVKSNGDGTETNFLAQAWCVTEQTLVESSSMRVKCRAREGCPCEQIRNVVTVPMSREGILEGSISLQINDDHDMDEYDSSTLQILANQATIAIQNARLFEESQYLRDQAEGLYRIALEQKNEAERKRRELEMAQDEIDAMEREQIISTERERIARELHDDVAQILSSIGMNLEWCRQHLPPDSPIEERIVLLKQLARNGLYEIRNAILGMSPVNIAELGLAESLEKLVGDFEKLSRIPTHLDVNGEPRHPADGVANALYHICQEALYNVFKHAQAQHVNITLTFEPMGTILSVVDDGIGISTGTSGVEPSVVKFGLKNMISRTEQLKGTLTISRGEEKGTRVEARIPG